MITDTLEEEIKLEEKKLLEKQYYKEVAERELLQVKINYLEKEVEYLKAELEFIKKYS